jgi:hypothetical protein
VKHADKRPRAKDILSWLACHTACFARLGGMPATVRVDNEKTAISRGARVWGTVNPGALPLLLSQRNPTENTCSTPTKCSTLILVVTSRCGNRPDLWSVQDGGADLDPGYRGAKSYTRKGTAKARCSMDFRSAAKSTVKKLVILRAMPSCGGVPKRRVGSKGQTSSHRDSG